MEDSLNNHEDKIPWEVGYNPTKQCMVGAML